MCYKLKNFSEQKCNKEGYNLACIRKLPACRCQGFRDYVQGF